MGRWLLNLAILSGLLLASYFLEVKIELHEALESLLRPRESYQADAIIVPAVLSVFVFLFIQMFQLKREAKRRRAAEQKALALSLHDPLTGLGNRRKLEQIIAGLAPGEARAVFMLDLDDFKPVNDIFGHAAGDAVLLEAAGRIAGICGPGALVCRFGGDEFAVLTGAIAGEDEAGLLAQRMVGAFYKPFMVGTAQSNVGVSIGVTMLHAGEMTGADAIRQADLALYQAKRDDHNDYRIFTQAMDDELRHRKLMERKLRAAIETGAVKTYFQPQVDLKTGEVMGFEALARWTDAELGNVPPSEFIALAEESGLIAPLFEHLLRSACRAAAAWPAHLKLSFNLSPRQLRDWLIGLRILSILGETGLSPSRLEVEVTETSLVDDKKLARELLGGLRNAGVRIAIDDFGTGFSSLNHLREFKFDSLNIGRAFVMALEQGGENAVIVNAILNLSKGLGLVATAEGIENEDQLASLLKSGCQQGQGYLFGRAMSGADVMALIEELAPEAMPVQSRLG